MTPFQTCCSFLPHFLVAVHNEPLSLI